jgi:hypothetical protein
VIGDGLDLNIGSWVAFGFLISDPGYGEGLTVGGVP